jgi:hypothetical protein
VEYFTPRAILLVDVSLYQDDRSDARTLRRRISDMSRERFDLAHEVGHTLLLQGSSLRNTAVGEAVEAPAFADLVDNSIDASLAGTTQASASFASPLDGMRFKLWSRRLDGPVKNFCPVQAFAPTRGSHELPGSPVLLTFRDDALPRDTKAALLRFLDGILAALRLMLVRVLDALSRRPDALAFVLVMLAACLR